MLEDCKRLLGWARGGWLQFQPLAPFLASGFTLGAGFCSYRPARMLLLCIGIFLFFVAAADWARSLLDRETGFASYQGPPQKIPVTFPQVLLATALAVIYTIMIAAGLKLLFLPSPLVFLGMAFGVFVISSLAAWRNVRQWWREGADYEQALKEEARMSHKLRIPPTH